LVLSFSPKVSLLEIPLQLKAGFKIYTTNSRANCTMQFETIGLFKLQKDAASGSSRQKNTTFGCRHAASQGGGLWSLGSLLDKIPAQVFRCPGNVLFCKMRKNAAYGSFSTKEERFCLPGTLS
jgi:hypothetical protein